MQRVAERERAVNLKMTPKLDSMRRMAANGTEIGYYGQRVVKFRGMEDAAKHQAAGFQRPK